jgi:hypothetical protein
MREVASSTTETCFTNANKQGECGCETICNGSYTKGSTDQTVRHEVAYTAECLNDSRMVSAAAIRITLSHNWLGIFSVDPTEEEYRPIHYYSPHQICPKQFNINPNS